MTDPGAGFSTRDGLVLFSSSLPGNHATMFGVGGGRLPYVDEAADFDDSKPSYTWGFLARSILRDGQRFVFATADRAVVGEVEGGGIRIVEDATVHVERDATGKPLWTSAAAAKADPVVLPQAAKEPEPAAPAVDALPPAMFLVSTAELPQAVEASPRLFCVVSPRPSRPKVSIVTCSHDRPEMLREAVESLRAQTDPDWEHLIYDDASTDPCVGGVLEWAAEDPRVRVWRGRRNLDRPAALWNFLMDRALGRYLTVLDDDNTKLLRFVEVMSGELDADPSLDIVTCGWLVRRAGRRDDPYFLNLSTSHDRLGQGSTCDGGSMLYRREVFERAGYFSEDLRTNEDWDWLHRATHFAKVKNLEACHATYRAHEPQRMTRSAALGSDADIVRLKDRVIRSSVGVRVVRPPEGRLTRSQQDVCLGLERGFAAIPWASAGDDVALVISPFQMGDDEIRNGVAGCRAVLFVHMEDPYALEANVARAKAVRGLGVPVWIATNDVATVPRYREIVGDRITVYPSLSVDDSIAVEPAERDIDVLLCGYAYPSRQRFVKEMLPLLRGRRVVLVGDGWQGQPVETHPTLTAEESYAMHARAKAVVCLHRVHGDCSDGPVEPRTVNRGYMEGYCGTRVFLDRSRGHHALDAGDVVWYDDPVDLAGKLHAYLDGSRSLSVDVFADKCRIIYTYRTRLVRILNCVRGDRLLAEIP